MYFYVAEREIERERKRLSVANNVFLTLEITTTAALLYALCRGVERGLSF